MGLRGQGQGQAGRAGTGHQDAGRAPHETSATRHQAAGSAATPARTDVAVLQDAAVSQSPQFVQPNAL
jgi:hypothetical protein